MIASKPMLVVAMFKVAAALPVMERDTVEARPSMTPSRRKLKKRVFVRLTPMFCAIAVP